MSETIGKPSYLESLSECMDYGRLCGCFSAIVGGIMSAHANPLFMKDVDAAKHDARTLDDLRAALKVFDQRREEICGRAEADRAEAERQSEEIGRINRRVISCIRSVDGDFRGRIFSADESMRMVHKICEEQALARAKVCNGGSVYVFGE